MKLMYDLKSRRQFLIGAGGALLAIPFLPSLLPRAEAAVSKSKRFICLAQDNGRYAPHWYPNAAAEAKLAAVSGVQYMRQMMMKDISGNISQILSHANFNGAMRNKLLLIRGLDGLWRNLEGHQTSSILAGNLGADPSKKAEAKPGPSIDYVMAKNVKSNPLASNSLSYLNLGVSPHQNDMSWKFNSSTNQMVQAGRVFSPINAFNSIFANVATGSQPAATPVPSTRRQKVVDSVIESYRQTIGSTKIAKNERDVLQEHMDMLNELEESLKETTSVPVLACTKPTGVSSKQVTTRDPKLREASTKQSMDIMIAAVKCGLVNIGTIMLDEPVDPVVYSNLGVSKYYHGLSHETMNSTSILKINTYFADKFAYFIKGLDVAEPGTDGTFLDNSLVMFGNGMGDGNLHSYMDMPVLLAGGLGGRISTGRYIDYTNRAARNYDGSYQGRHYNALLVTLLQAMGLSQTDYQQMNVAEGFGSDTYHVNADQWRRNRKDPLPTLLK